MTTTLAQRATSCARRRTLTEGKCEERAAGGDGDVLLSVHGVRHRPAVNLSTERYLPEQIAVPCVEREEVAFLPASKEYVGCCRHHAGPRDVVHLEFPFARQPMWIERANDPVAFFFLFQIRRQRRLAHWRAVRDTRGSRKLAFESEGPRVLPACDVKETRARAV